MPGSSDLPVVCPEPGPGSFRGKIRPSTLNRNTHTTNTNWQCGVQNACAPTLRNTGTTTPGAPHTELGVDCEPTVKIRGEAIRADLKKLSPIKIVDRAERARESAVKKPSGSPLAVS